MEVGPVFTQEKERIGKSSQNSPKLVLILSCNIARVFCLYVIKSC